MSHIGPFRRRAIARYAGEGNAENQQALIAYLDLLKACADKKDLCGGTEAHADILKGGFLEAALPTLINMYVRCGAFDKAKEVLETVHVRDVFSWTALIAGYAQHGKGQNALNYYERMLQEGITPNEVTFTCVLKACGSIGAVDMGEVIHDKICRQGLLEKNVFLGSALVDMYARCGALAKAQRVLEVLHVQSVASWNALIAGYTRQGKGRDALSCFRQMQNKCITPNEVTYICALKACGIMGAADEGQEIHEEIKKHGLLEHSIVIGGALVDMYAKCGALVKAQCVLEALPVRNVISWSALIAGYTQQGLGQEALDCLEKMQNDGFSPSAVTFGCILKACGMAGAVHQGKQVHEEIARKELLVKNLVLGNALVDMYTKCGDLVKAQQVLKELPIRTVVTWSSLIAGYAQQGKWQDVLNCFECMQHEGVSPNNITFASMLNACSHTGFVDDAQVLFTAMSHKYGIKPILDHYTCMIDLFGRAGHIEKAIAIVHKIPASVLASSDSYFVWHSLLGACQKSKDTIVGRWAYEHAMEEDKTDSASYVLMDNIFIAAGLEEGAKCRIEDYLEVDN